MESNLQREMKEEAVAQCPITRFINKFTATFLRQSRNHRCVDFSNSLLLADLFSLYFNAYKVMDMIVYDLSNYNLVQVKRCVYQ